MVQEPTQPLPKERRRYCYPRGSTIGLAEGRVDARGTSVLEDSLVGLVHMLGHLRCSTLQGQLQEKRRQGKNLSLGLSRVKGWERAGSSWRSEQECIACTTQAGSLEWGRCEVKQRGWPSQPSRNQIYLWPPRLLSVLPQEPQAGGMIHSVRSAQPTPLSGLSAPLQPLEV